jgi:hypothetical protein
MAGTRSSHDRAAFERNKSKRIERQSTRTKNGWKAVHGKGVDEASDKGRSLDSERVGKIVKQEEKNWNRFCTQPPSLCHRTTIKRLSMDSRLRPSSTAKDQLRSKART